MGVQLPIKVEQSTPFSTRVGNGCPSTGHSRNEIESYQISVAIQIMRPVFREHGAIFMWTVGCPGRATQFHDGAPEASSCELSQTLQSFVHFLWLQRFPVLRSVSSTTIL